MMRLMCILMYDSQKNPNEDTLYIKSTDACILIVSLYASDVIYIDNSNVMIKEFQMEMMKQCEMNDLELLHHFLGLRVN